MNCNHTDILFASGDYYIFCVNCYARWSRTSETQPEFGVGLNGEKIGTTPELANQGFNETSPHRYRDKLIVKVNKTSSRTSRYKIPKHK